MATIAETADTPMILAGGRRMPRMAGAGVQGEALRHAARMAIMAGARPAMRIEDDWQPEE